VKTKAIQGSFYQTTNYRPKTGYIPSVLIQEMELILKRVLLGKNLEGAFKFLGRYQKNKYEFNLATISGCRTPLVPI
jgi:hypothetical protein